MSDPDLPDGFDINTAERWDRVEAADGTVWVVLKSDTLDRQTLVREDVVEYGYLTHPAVTGLAGLVAVVVGLVGPLFTAYQIAAGLDSTAAGIGVLLVGGAAAWVLANVLYYRTEIGLQLDRFLEWYEHRRLIVGRDPA